VFRTSWRHCADKCKKSGGWIGHCMPSNSPWCHVLLYSLLLREKLVMVTFAYVKLNENELPDCKWEGMWPAGCCLRLDGLTSIFVEDLTRNINLSQGSGGLNYVPLISTEICYRCVKPLGLCLVVCKFHFVCLIHLPVTKLLFLGFASFRVKEGGSWWILCDTFPGENFSFLK
jgi:hypothetical protein